MSFERREYQGNAPATTISADIASSSTSISIAANTGWPTGSVGPFHAVIDPDTASEEKVLFTSRTGGTLTVSSRGVDGTTAVAHSAGATIKHVGVARDFDEANAHYADTTRDDHTQYVNNARHDITARHQFGAALGTPSTPAATSTSGSAGTGSGPARSDHVHAIGAASVVAGSFATGVIATADLADSAVTSAKIADATIATGDLADTAVTAAKVADGVVGTAAKLADGVVTTAKIADANVTQAKFASTILPVVLCTSSTRPASPVAGQQIYETNTGNTLVYQSASTGWTPPWNTPWGIIAQATPTQTGPGIGTSETAINGTSITVTTIANRKYKIIMQGSCQSNVQGDVMTFNIQRDSSNISNSFETTYIADANVGLGYTVMATDTPAAGSHTYRGGSSRGVGTGSGTVNAGGFITLEDIGPTAAPA